MSHPESPGHDGVSASDLSTFEKELLFAITEIEAAGNESYGLAIKRRLEDRFETAINHGRLYPNLDDLVSQGLIEKSKLDKRTNEYTLTGAGAQLITKYAQRLQSLTNKLERSLYLGSNQLNVVTTVVHIYDGLTPSCYPV